MKKIIILGIIVVLLTVSLSGCIDTSPKRQLYDKCCSIARLENYQSLVCENFKITSYEDAWINLSEDGDFYRIRLDWSMYCSSVGRLRDSADFKAKWNDETEDWDIIVFDYHELIKMGLKGDLLSNFWRSWEYGIPPKEEEEEYIWDEFIFDGNWITDFGEEWVFTDFYGDTSGRLKIWGVIDGTDYHHVSFFAESSYNSLKKTYLDTEGVIRINVKEFWFDRYGVDLYHNYTFQDNNNTMILTFDHNLGSSYYESSISFWDDTIILTRVI